MGLHSCRSMVKRYFGGRSIQKYPHFLIFSKSKILSKYTSLMSPKVALVFGHFWSLHLKAIAQTRFFHYLCWTKEQLIRTSKGDGHIHRSTLNNIGYYVSVKSFNLTPNFSSDSQCFLRAEALTPRSVCKHNMLVSITAHLCVVVGRYWLRHDFSW